MDNIQNLVGKVVEVSFMGKPCCVTVVGKLEVNEANVYSVDVDEGESALMTFDEAFVEEVYGCTIVLAGSVKSGKEAIKGLKEEEVKMKEADDEFLPKNRMTEYFNRKK